MINHFLGIKGLSKENFLSLLTNAQNFVEVSDRDLKKVPALRGKTIINLFLEASTRTRSSFEIAGKRLSADTINISASGSSIEKGETLLDTAKNLEAMRPDILVIRHKASGAPHFLAKQLKYTAVVNAGDGMNEHPTQSLLDFLSLKQTFEARKQSFEKRTIAIVGDVFHSRVARSNILAASLLGWKIKLVGPRTLLPFEFAQAFQQADISIDHHLVKGIEGADVVYCLRMQTERQGNYFVPSLLEYSRDFCISERILAKYAPDAVVMHPGPINRGCEISSEVVDGPRSLVVNQVTNGVAARMAVLFSLATRQKEENTNL